MLLQTNTESSQLKQCGGNRGDGDTWWQKVATAGTTGLDQFNTDL